MWREELGLVEMLFTYIGEIKEFESYEAWKPILIDILSCHEDTRRHKISFATAYNTEEMNECTSAEVGNMRNFGGNRRNSENISAPLMSGSTVQHWQSNDYVTDVCHERNDDIDKKMESLTYPVHVKDNNDCGVVVKDDIADEDENGMPMTYGHRNLRFEGNDDESTQSFIKGSDHFGEVQYESSVIPMLDSLVKDIGESHKVSSVRYVEPERNAATYMEDNNKLSAIEERSDRSNSTEIVADEFGGTWYHSSTGGKRISNDINESANGRLKAISFGNECYSIASNTEKRHFRCKICGSYFKKKSHLKIHIRYHNGERPYQCNMCEKSYCQQCDLNKHLRSHNGERPFHCPLCQKSYALKWILKRHMATHGIYGLYPGKPR